MLHIAGRMGGAFAIMVLLLGTISAQQNPTLATVLKQEAAPVPVPPPNIPVDSPITRFATLNDDQEFLIAYYLDNPRNELRFPLLLAHFDRRSKKWRSVRLNSLKVNFFAGTDHDLPGECLGSVINIAAIRRGIT